MQIQRVYDLNPKRRGEYRVLVDRVWPRGVKKESLNLDEWLKQIAPSSDLRKWFGHDPTRWEEFQERYRRELEAQGDELARLAALASKKTLVLLYSARDAEHNQAIVIAKAIGEMEE
ncbi:MAG: DUF488 family protein [bacterium]|nr:DUF488 family protein [bacterium]